MMEITHEMEQATELETFKTFQHAVGHVNLHGFTDMIYFADENRDIEDAVKMKATTERQ